MSKRYDAPHPLFGCQLKLDRAYEHIETVDRAIERFVNRNPHESVAKIYAEAREYRVWMKVRDTPPLWLSTVIGDAVHNLRSALDHLVYELIRANGNTPGGSAAYPIFTKDPADPEGDKRTRDRWKAMTKGLHADDLAKIESTQPYKGGDAFSWRELLMLNRLSNWDKHNALNLTSSILVDSVFTVRGNADCAIGQIETTNGPFEHGTVIARGSCVFTGPDPKVNVEGHVVYGIAFGESGPPEVAGVSVGIALMSIANVVHDIVHEFAINSPWFKQN